MTHLSSSKLMGVLTAAVAVAVLAAGCVNESQQKQRHLDRARESVARERYGDAIIELKNALQIDPRDDGALVMLGDAYMKTGDVETAATHYGDAVDINPDNLTAHLKLGRIYLAAKRPMEARMAAKWIIEKAPANPEGYSLLAGVQVMENNLPEAIRTMEEAVAITPRALNARMFLAHLVNQDGRRAAAEKIYLDTLAAHPGEPLAFLEAARFYAERGLWEKTAAILEKMGPAAPPVYPKVRDLARLCEAANQWELAEQLYRKGVAAAGPEETGPLLDLGVHHAVRRQYEPALAAMQKALEIRENDPEILVRIAGVHLDAGDRAAAEKAVDRALAANPAHAGANFLKGEIHYARREYTAALQQFELTITHDPDNFKAYYYKAMCLKQRGTLEQPESDLFRAAAGFQGDDEGWVEKQVEENLLKALELNPKLLVARHLLAEVYLERRDVNNARRQIESALAQAPRHGKSLALLGTLKVLEGDLKGAEALCKRILSIDPQKDFWQMRLGVVYRLMGRRQEALAAFQKTLELDPTRLYALNSIVEMHLEREEFDAALQACRTHLAQVAEDPFLEASIRNMEGMIYLRWRKPAEARRVFEAVVAGHPDFIAPRLGLAGIHAASGDTDAAIAQYEAVLEINGDHFPACMALGGLYSDRKDGKRAEIYYRRALAIKPGDARAANNLAFVLSSDDRRVREALELARAAKLKQPHDPEIKDTLGWLYYRTGQYNKAVEELESALKSDPERALPNFHLGLAYYRQGRFDVARRHLKAALAADPDFPGAEDARKIVDE